MNITNTSGYKLDISSNNVEDVENGVRFFKRVLGIGETITISDEFIKLKSIQDGVVNGDLTVDSFDNLGTAPITTADLAQVSTVAAMVVPSMTNAQAVALSATATPGTIIYDTDNDKLVFVDGGAGIETITSA